MVIKNNKIVLLIIVVSFELGLFASCSNENSNFISSELTTFFQESETIPDGDYSIINILLSQFEKGINEKNIELYLSVFDDEMKQSLEQNLKRNKTLPYYAIENKKIVNIIKLTDKDIDGIAEVDANIIDERIEYKIYYLYSIDSVKEKMETKYISNGENFRICVITKRNDEWKISQYSSVQPKSFLLKNINLGSITEKVFLESGK